MALIADPRQNAETVLYNCRKVITEVFKVHIDATWRIRMNCPYAVATRGYLNDLFFTRATLASAGISCRRVSVCPSVCHKSVFY